MGFLSGGKFTRVIPWGSDQFYADIRWNWSFLTKFQKSRTTKDRKDADPSSGRSSKAFFLKKQKMVIRQTIFAFLLISAVCFI